MHRKPSISQKKLIWATIPNAILIQILALCDLTDINALTLACRMLHHRIYQHESAISQEYLGRRQQRQRKYTLSSSPGDDLTFIADLFPPPPPQYTTTSDDGGGGGSGSCINQDNNIPEYSFDYVADLTRCWRTCIRLSFYLAEATVQHHLETDPVAHPLWRSSKTEREVVYSRGVSLVQARLLCPMYLIITLSSWSIYLTNIQNLSGLFPRITRRIIIIIITTTIHPNPAIHPPTTPLHKHPYPPLHPPLHGPPLCFTPPSNGP